jgi:hypothetical protein
MIRIRAHHLLCIPRFYNGGYDKRFAENMKGICLMIRENPDVKIKVIVGELDDLCEKCPYEYENRCVQSREIGKWVVSQDEKVAGYLDLKSNSIHVAKEVFNLSINAVNEKNIEFVCEGCIFLENCIRVGINSAFMKDLSRKL